MKQKLISVIIGVAVLIASISNTVLFHVSATSLPEYIPYPHLPDPPFESFSFYFTDRYNHILSYEDFVSNSATLPIGYILGQYNKHYILYTICISYDEPAPNNIGYFNTRDPYYYRTFSPNAFYPFGDTSQPVVYYIVSSIPYDFNNPDDLYVFPIDWERMYNIDEMLNTNTRFWYPNTEDAVPNPPYLDFQADLILASNFDFRHFKYPATHNFYSADLERLQNYFIQPLPVYFDTPEPPTTEPPTSPYTQPPPPNVNVNVEVNVPGLEGEADVSGLKDADYDEFDTDGALEFANNMDLSLLDQLTNPISFIFSCLFDFASLNPILTPLIFLCLTLGIITYIIGKKGG